MVIVALRNDVADQRDRWIEAYATDPDWLSQDLSNHALPQLAAFLLAG